MSAVQQQSMSVASPSLTDQEKWANYDLAKNRMSIVIGHYAELVFTERQKANPDANKISQWESSEEEASALDDQIEVDNQVLVTQVNAVYGPMAKKIMEKGR